MKTPKQKINLITFILVMFLASISFAQQSNIYGSLGGKPAPNYEDNGPILWNQMDVPGSSFMVTQEVTNPENETETCISADDFYVPEGETWDIGTIAFVGSFYDLGVGPVDTFNVIFYDDAPGLPGAEIVEHYDLVGFTYETEDVNGYTVGTYHLKLPVVLTLDEGHYWMGVQAKGSYTEMGKWGWIDYWAGSQPALDEQWHWKNPLDGLGTGFTDWTPAIDVVAIFMNYDLSFALYEPAFEKDLAVYSIISPVGDEGMTNAETVTINIRNEGTTPQAGFDLKYVFNGVEVIENIGGVTINPNEFYEYSFTQTVDMEIAGPYELSVATMLAGDEYPDNDMIETTIYSFGTIYIMENGNTAATVTTCSGTSVDMGGLDANFEQTDYGTVTFYPAAAGSQIRLTFLEFDIQWGEMELYDGTTISSPSFGIFDKGTGSPGVITAFNAEGALTMRFEASGWDNGPGWVAFISCFDPVADDFAVLDISLSSNAITQGEFVTAYTTVQNFGSLVQAKDVSFTANEEVFATVNTGDLDPWEIITVEATWNPMVADIYTLTTSVPEDDGIDDNNMATMEQEVISNAYLIEGFENETFPPEGWTVTAGLWYRSDNNPMFGLANATIFTTPSAPDTLITPVLQIEADDEISYYIRGSWWWQSDFEVVYKEVGTDTWVSLAYYGGFTIPVAPTQYTLDLNDYAGQTGQIGFIAPGNVQYWSIGEVFLDEINGPKKLSYLNNLNAFEFVGSASPNVNEAETYEFTIKNIGTLPIDGADYTVKLMDDEGAELASVDGLTIQPLEELVFELENTFTVTGTIAIHGYIDFETDENEDDNSSKELTVYIQQEGTQQVNIGDDLQETWNYPLGTNGAYKLSEMLYLNDEIGLSGIMNGISFFYRSDEVFPIEDYPVDVYIGETTADELPSGTDWIPSTELSLAFSGTLTMYPGDNMVYIPFDSPYSYGGDNLVVMTYKSDDLWYGSTYWYCHSTDGMQTKWASEYNFVPDPADPSPLWPNDTYLRPNARIYVLPTQGDYCTPQTIDGTDNGYYIDGVTLNTLANTGTGSQGGADYNDYTDMSTNLEQTKYYELTFDVNTDGTGGSVAAWIDFNNDSDFDDDGEKICQMSGEGASFSITVPVVVPDGIELGIKRMRVRAGDFSSAVNACETIQNGEAEDYLVNVTQTQQVYNPVTDFSASNDGSDVSLMWGVPVNPGQAYLEGFESSTWPVNDWQVKYSASLTDVLMDPVDASWEQSNEADYVYNGDAAAYISADAPDFNWLITPQFLVYGDDALSFGIHYTSDVSGYTKFYAMVEVDGSWITALEYTEETAWANQYDEKVIVDLADFAGKMIRVAFVTENNSAYPVAVDDVIISSVVNLTDGFDGLTGYEIYREGVMIGEITDPSVVSFDDVLSETENYTYCVVAMYSSDDSEEECIDLFYLAPLTPPVNLMGAVEGYDVNLQWTAPNAAIMRFNDDFEAYNAGEQLVEQNSADWTTWNNDVGGAEDPYITSDMAYSGGNSVVIESFADLLWLNDEVLKEGRFSYNFKLYVPEGYTAYFNVLQEYTLSVSASWGFQAFFDQNGNGYIDANGQNSTSFTYVYDEWMYVELDINLDTDWAEFMINGESIYEWPWSAGIFGTGDLNQLQASDFYAWNVNGTPKFYIDDVNLTEVFENEDLLTYNVYRDDVVLENVGETMYTDMDLEIGDYQYFVTALYDEGESDPSNVLDISVAQAAYLPFFEDFDNFAAGEQVACQDPVNWTTWSNLPCDPIEDAYISDAQAYSGSNSIVIDDDNDLVLSFPEAYTTGTYKSSFWMYIPEGRDAYWNVLQNYDGASSTWGLEVFFDGGTGSISIDNEKTFDYEFDTWMLMELYINLDEDGAQLFVNGESVHFWSWTNGGVTQFGAFDFYGMVGFYSDCEYYFDDIMIEEVEWSMPVLIAPTNLEGDLADNDVHLTWDLLSGDLSEIVYDDGTNEQSWWISGNPTSADDMMALRLTMPEDGILQEVSFFTRTGTTGAFNFSDVMVCPDDGAGLPDLDNAYENFGEQVIENTEMEWLMFTMTTPLDMVSGEDFWIVAQWPGGNTDGPFIGGDNTTEPTEDRNYWSNVPGVWNLFTTSNFMMRGYYSPAGKSYAGGGIHMITHMNDKDMVVPVSTLTNPVLSDGTQSWKAPTIITGATELSGYNVYRDGSMIDNTAEKMYDDMDLPVGQYEYYVTAVYDLGESDPSNTVVIDVITGVDQIGVSEVHIYPNPVTDLIYVETEAAVERVIMLNANGQVVIEEDVTDVGTFTIDASNLGTGIYYLRIESEDGWLNKKIIKK